MGNYLVLRMAPNVRMSKSLIRNGGETCTGANRFYFEVYRGYSIGITIRGDDRRSYRHSRLNLLRTCEEGISDDQP
jgi:hypothetical protein